jgi:ATP-binding cassette, subfamily B, bacterial
MDWRVFSARRRITVGDPASQVPVTTQFKLMLDGRHRLVAGLIVASVVAGLTEAAILAAVAQAAASLVNGASRVHASLGPVHVSVTIGVLLAVTFVMSLFRLALQAPLSYLPSRLIADMAANAQRALVDAFTRASWEAQSRDREGKLQELANNQTAQASVGAIAATSLVSSLFTLIALVLSALLLDVVAAAIVLVLAILLAGLMRPLNQIGARRSEALGAAALEMAIGINETTRLAEEHHVFGVAAAVRERVDDLIEPARHQYFHAMLIGRIVPNVYQSLVYLIVVAGLAGLHAANAGHVASLGAVVLVLVRAGSYGQQVQGAYLGVRQTWPFLERVLKATAGYRASVPVTGDRPLTRVESIGFEDVSFAYVPGQPVLDDISFEVAAGETIGIVGPSGAGKSTLVQLLLNLRGVQRGFYVVNDVPVAEYSSDDWHARIAYVPQDPRLLHASVADNNRFFRPLVSAAVERAARLARIHDEIMSWPKGYDTIIGPRADAVSGGQRQRICIARALAAEPQVLVLDEPTSALDPHSESLLQQSLIGLKQEVTLFIVAHRMSTLDICDRIMVIVDGRLEAFDTITNLKQANSYYRYASTLAAGAAGG